MTLLKTPFPDVETRVEPYRATGEACTRPTGADATVIGTLISTSIASGIVQFNSTLLNVALPSVKATFDASVTQLQWIVNGYTLGFLALLLFAGAMGDKFGARRVFLVGCLFFAAASLGCSFAMSPSQLIFARVLQGLGAALLVPNSVGLLRRACGNDGRRFARALGVWTAVGGAGFAAGPVLGGALLTVVEWHMLFIASIPLCLLGFFAGLRSLRSSAASADSASWDWGGQIAIMVTLLALAGAITEARRLGVGHPIVVGSLLVAVFGGIALVWIERVVKRPILPPALFSSIPFNAALAYGFLVNMSFAGVFFVLTLYLQSALGYTPWEAGVAFIPLTLTFIVSNTAGGRLVARYGFRSPMAIGAATAALGYALLFRLDANLSMGRMLIGFILIPSGVGVATPATMAAALSFVTPALAGTASAVVSVVRQVAALFGVASAGLLIGAGALSDILVGVDHAAVFAAGLVILAMVLGCFVKVEQLHPKA
jgi:MFS transporter, DHA2 family, methylenomycin A resistance protein